MVLIGAFGALETGEIGPAWRALLEDLRASGHDCLLVPVCLIRSTADPVANLDPSTSRGTRAQSDRTLQALLAALSQTWFPTPARLRRLRQAIPGAGLHVELLAYNDPSVIHDDFHLNLRPEQLLVGLHRFRDLAPELRASLRKAIEAWRAGLDLGARDIERLQGDLLSPRKPGAYPHLERQAAQAAAGLGRQPSMVVAQFCSMLPMIRRLAERGVEDDWKPLLRNAERVALATRRPSPSDAERTDLATPTHTLRQRHERLTVAPGLGGLLDIGAQAYSPQMGQWVQAGLPAGLPAGLDVLEILDRGYRWRLRADPCPAWAQRAWVDTSGLFAAHVEGAVYAWTPASPERPEGGWEPRRSPWGWAADTGIDEHGLWATLRVGDAAYCLRWIPPGEFLMGSPDDEDERDDDETLHEVRLTQGFWLGETSVTQAFWQAVTGSNQSHFRGGDLPVEQVSWDDCEAFLDQLKQHLPGFRATLPSEAQWEYACRACTRTRYWWGDALDETRASNGGQT